MKSEKEVLLEKIKAKYPYIDVKSIKSAPKGEIDRMKKLIPEFTELMNIMDREAKDRKKRNVSYYNNRNNF